MKKLSKVSPPPTVFLSICHCSMLISCRHFATLFSLILTIILYGGCSFIPIHWSGGPRLKEVTLLVRDTQLACESWGPSPPSCLPPAPGLGTLWPYCCVSPESFQLHKAFVNTHHLQSTHILGLCGPQTHRRHTELSLLECFSSQSHLTASLLNVKGISRTPFPEGIQEPQMEVFLAQAHRALPGSALGLSHPAAYDALPLAWEPCGGRDQPSQPLAGAPQAWRIV